MLLKLSCHCRWRHGFKPWPILRIFFIVSVLLISELCVSTLKHYFHVLCLVTSLDFHFNGAPSFHPICVWHIQSVTWVSPPFWWKCTSFVYSLLTCCCIKDWYLDPYQINCMEITVEILFRFAPNFIAINEKTWNALYDFRILLHTYVYPYTLSCVFEMCMILVAYWRTYMCT